MKMKKTVLRLLFLTLTFYACTKQQLAEDSGCIERLIIPENEHSINMADIASANALFLNNNIDNSKYRYNSYIHDSTQTYFSPYAKFDNKVVMVDEYTNGLKIFTGQLVFTFKNEVFNFKGGYPTNGTTLNATPMLTIGQLRKLFLNHIEQFDHKGIQYKDSCFTAEFGYYNLNAGTSYAPENLIKAWSLTLKNRNYPSNYPVAFYQDTDGKLIYYDNGIRTFK
jgi:hypothetical protein